MSAPLASLPMNSTAGTPGAAMAAGGGDPLGLFGLLLAGLGLDGEATAATGEGKSEKKSDAPEEDSAGTEQTGAAAADPAQLLAMMMVQKSPVTVDVPVDAEAGLGPPATQGQPVIPLAAVADEVQISPPVAPSTPDAAEILKTAAPKARAFADASPDIAPSASEAKTPAPSLPQVAATPTPVKGAEATLPAQAAERALAATAAPTPGPSVQAAVQAQSINPPTRFAPASKAEGRGPPAGKGQASPVDGEAPARGPTFTKASSSRADAPPAFFAALRGKPELTAERAAAQAAEIAQPDAEGEPAAPAPQAAATAQAELAAPSTPHPVRGAPETVAKLAADIVRKLDGASTRFEIALDPTGLGHVDVKVEVAANGRVHAAITFDNPHAAVELGRRAGELRHALEQAGFDLTGGSLSFDVANQNGQGRGHAFDQDRSGGRPAQAAFEAALTLGDEPILAPAAWSRGKASSGVDIRI